MRFVHYAPWSQCFLTVAIRAMRGFSKRGGDMMVSYTGQDTAIIDRASARPREPLGSYMVTVWCSHSTIRAMNTHRGFCSLVRNLFVIRQRRMRVNLSLEDSSRGMEKVCRGKVASC